MKMADDLSIEEAISKELEALADEQLGEDTNNNDDQSFEDLSIEQDSVLENQEDSLIPSMQEYLSQIQSQSAQFQAELDECDELLHQSDLVSARKTENSELEELAKQEGLTVEQLKQKVLHEIEEEEEEERNLVMNDVAMDTVTDLLSTAQMSARSHQADGENPMGAFITSLQTHGADTLAMEHSDAMDAAPVTSEETAVTLNNNNVGDGDNGEQVENKPMQAIEPPPDDKFTLNADEGVVAEVFDSEVLERQLMKDVLEMEEQRKAMHEQRMKELTEIRKAEEQKAGVLEEKRQQKQQEIKHEEKLITQQKQENETKLREEAEALQKQIELSLEQFEKEINELARQTEKEKLELENTRVEEKRKQQEKRENAAVRIQKMYRGYMVRKEHGQEVHVAVEEAKERKFNERVEEVQQEIDVRVEKEKKEKEEKELAQREEEERKRLEEEEKQRKVEEEKLRKEEEKKRKEEEKKRKAEEERQRKEEEKRKKEEEKRRKEEEKRRKAEEEKQRKEEEKRRKEEEKNRKEEERKKKLEEEKLKREEEERLKREEEERKRKELEIIEEELKKEQARIAKEEQEKQKQIEEELKTMDEELQKNEDNLKKNTELKNQEKIDIIGAKVMPEQRGMTELLISEVARVNTTETSENGRVKPNAHTPRSPKTPATRPTNSPGNKTPRPPSAKKPDSTYERPISAKKKLANQSPEAIHVAGNNVPPAMSVDNTRKSILSQHELAKSRQWGEYLPKPIDEARLNWIGKQCKSLSKIVSESTTRKAKASKKPVRRPSSAKSLAPLDEQTVLAAARVSTLKMVTTVELSDLPGCTLKTLSQCPHLKTLTMTNCNLITTDGLEDCKQLQYVNLRNNKLVVISMKDLQSLIYADLSNNALSSVHGLDGCASLKYLDVSRNKISRIAGLDSAKKLHTLCLSHNQLITSRGLSETPSIQYLDLSHNHLQSADDLENLALLQTLIATGNNLMQVPKLTNHVILDKLILSDNSISFLSGLTQTWLPMLSHLNLSQNSISVLDPMLNFLLLEHLDLSGNQLLDTEQLLPALLATRYLLTLELTDNPICEELNFRTRIQQVVPFLEKLNSKSVSSPNCETLQRTEFERLCLAQSLQVQQLHMSYTQAVKKASSVSDSVEIHAKYFETSHTLATDIRYTHEYGVSMVTPKPVDMNFDVTEQNGALATDVPTKLLTPVSSKSVSKNKFEDALKGNAAKISPRSAKDSFGVSLNARSGKNAFDMAVSNSNSSKNAFDMAVSNSNSSKNAFEQAISKQNSVGIDIMKQSQTSLDPKASFEQNLMKSMASTNSKALAHSPSNDMKSKFDAALTNSRLNENGMSAAGLSNGDAKSSLNFTTSVKTSKVLELLKTSGGDYTKLLHYSATKIQSCWRGYILRKRMALALSYVKFDDLDDDLEDFDEVNLGDFDFNMDDLDRDLLVPDTPQLPANHPVLGKLPSQPQTLKKPPAVPPLFNMTNAAHNTHGWERVDSALSGGMGGVKPPLPPLSRLSDAQTYDSKATARARKEEKIAEDWGFKDNKTAELMLQRARKLKYNALKKKKLSKLDPKQRLELYKRLEDASRVKVQASRKTSLPRKEYFQAREDEIRREEQEKRITQHEQVQRTFEWVHTHVGQEFDVTSSRIQNSKGIFGSESNLPKMDPAVLAGGRAMLARSPASMDVQSIESNSTIADPATKPVRLWRTKPDQNSKLPPIKTNSAPSAKTKERMSFRNPKTDIDVGWGGGRKRNSMNP